MIKNLLILTGEDNFRLRGRVNYYKKMFREKYPDGEIQTFDNENSFQDFENAVFTPNLFGGKRLIFTQNFWNAENFETAQKTEFFKRLPEQIDLCTVIFLESKLDKRLKSTKFLLSGESGKIELFEPLDEYSLYNWAQRYAKDNDAELDRSLAQFLINRCGVDMWNLSREIEKLATLSEGKITKELIEETTIPHPQSVIWDFLESLSKKNIKIAIQRFRTLLESGSSVHEIFPMICREMRIHAQIRSGLDQNLTSKEIASETKIHPFVVQKTVPLSKNFSMDQIQMLYDYLFEIDKKIKTGGIYTSTTDTSEYELAIEKFIVKACK